MSAIASRVASKGKVPGNWAVALFLSLWLLGHAYGAVTGGCAESTLGSETIITCTGDGTFTPPAGVTSVRYLIVGGGAGGGGLPTGGNLAGGGGGGAGGVHQGSGFAVAPGNAYNITVGAGGAGGVGGVSQGGAGGSSTFATLTASGGGGGASNSVNNNGDNGASGGGGRLTGVGGTGIAGQGNAGGSGNSSAGAGGGGGAGGAGGSTNNNTGGAGGAGISDNISGTLVSYGTGGAGGSYAGARANGAPAAANTGDGGDGAQGANGGSAVIGGAGGSGIVILRFTTSTTLQPVAEYRFDECTQYTNTVGQVVDSMGSFPGTPMQGLQNAVGGQINKDADFTNATRYVNIPNGPLLGDWTISVWFQMPFAGSTVHSSQYYIIGSVSGGGDFAFLDRNSGYRWGVYTVGTGGGTTNGIFQFNTLSNGWHHMVVVGQGTRTLLYIDGIYRDQVNRKVTGTFQFLGTSFDSAGTTSGQSWGSPLDEYKVFNVPLSATQITAIYNNELAGNNWDGTSRPNPCIAFNHLRIEHAGSGVTCAPTSLTLKACADALCTSLYPGGVTGTLTATGTPTVNWIGGASFAIGATGVATKDAQVTTAGTITWGAAGVAPVASNATSCYIGTTASCGFTAALAGFLFNVPDHYSDTSQSITVSAVRQSNNSLACTPAFASISKTVAFGCSYNDPASGTLPVVVGGSNVACGATTGVSLNFNASGVATTTVRYADVGRMALTATYTGSGSEAGLVMTGTDLFIAAPASFAVVPSGPYGAGNPFSVTVTAKNASGNTTPSFGKESTTENVALTHTLVGPAGGNNPALTGTTTLLDATFQAGNGVATTNSIAWGEVGDISLTATLAGSNYLGSGLGATGNAAAGPFKPAYFDTAVTPGTGSFTYSGQPFGVTVTAKNASGTTTQNYKGSYAKTVTLTDANSATNNSATLGSLANASIAAASFTNGVAAVTNPTYTFTSKTTAPLESPVSAPLKLRAVDTDGVTSNGHAEGTTPLRAGRLRLVNFYGSNLLKPRIEYRAEYWDGNRWATNTLDSTTALVAGNIATGGLTVSALTALNAGIGFITFNTAAAGSYDIAYDLNAAGVDTSCNAAHAGTPANKPWLQGYWSAPANCGGVAAWAQDPSARVRLGSPRAPYIYMRERY